MSDWSELRLLAYLERIAPVLDDMTHYELLDVDQGLGDAQAAFHQMANRLHPDLWRGKIPDDKHRLLTEVYGKISNAYHTLRHPKKRKDYDASLGDRKPLGKAAAALLDPKAKQHLRRAQASAKRRDWPSAVLEVKMAIKNNPESALLLKFLGQLQKMSKK